MITAVKFTSFENALIDVNVSDIECTGILVERKVQAVFAEYGRIA